MPFKRAIIRKPGKNFASGISSSQLGQPVYTKTIQQHASYAAALEKCGLQLTILEADLRFPDGTFVEDVAVLTDRCAVLTNPGAPSRKGEAEIMKPTLLQFYDRVQRVTPPGTVEGGDICQADDHFFIGISERTNQEGGTQLKNFLQDHGYTASFIDCRSIPGLLHLKSGMAYLGDETMVVTQSLVDHPGLVNYRKIVVEPSENYAANCVRVNDYVLAASGFPRFLDELDRSGYRVLLLEVTEFEKMDGGLSCLSLRF
jgi:dimethylargininase